MFFDNCIQTVTYANAGGSGHFTMTLTGGSVVTYQGTDHYEYDLTGPLGDTRTLTAQITDAQFDPIPEPASTGLVGPIVGGIVLLAIKKRMGKTSASLSFAVREFGGR